MWNSGTHLGFPNSVNSQILIYWRKQNDFLKSGPCPRPPYLHSLCQFSLRSSIFTASSSPRKPLTPPKFPFSSSHGKLWNNDVGPFVLLEQVTWHWITERQQAEEPRPWYNMSERWKGKSCMEQGICASNEVRKWGGLGLFSVRVCIFALVHVHGGQKSTSDVMLSFGAIHLLSLRDQPSPAELFWEWWPMTSSPLTYHFKPPKSLRLTTP